MPDKSPETLAREWHDDVFGPPIPGRKVRDPAVLDNLVILLRSRDERALRIARDVADGNGTAAEVLRRLEAPDA